MAYLLLLFISYASIFNSSLSAPDPLVLDSTIPNADVSLNYVTMLFALGASIILFLLFLLLRLLSPTMYGAKIDHQFTWWGWISVIFKKTQQDTFNEHGLDAMTYLQFSRTLFLFSLFIFCYSIGILLPIDFYAKVNVQNPSPVAHDLVSRILFIPFLFQPPLDMMQTIYVMTRFMAVLFNSISFYVLFYQLFATYSQYRLRYSQQSHLENYAIFIHNLPTNLSNEEIKSIFEVQFPNKVLSVHRVQQAKLLNSMLVKYADLLEQLEIWKYNHQLEKEGSSKPSAPSLHQSTLMNNEIEMETPVDPIDDQLKMTSIELPPSQIQPSPDQDHELIPTQSPTCISCCAPKHAQSYARFIQEGLVKKQHLESKMAFAESLIVPTTHAFILFRSLASATLSSNQCFIYNDHACLVEPAPQVSDVYWHTLSYTSYQLFFLRLLVNFFVFFSALFWAAFTTFAQALVHFEYLAQNQDWNIFHVLFHDHPKVMSLIVEFLPTMFIVILFAIFRALLRIVIQLECLHTRTTKLRSYVNKLYWVLIFDVFLASVLSGSFWSIVYQFLGIAANPLSLLQTLATRIPMQANFFINYFAINSVLWSISMLVQPIRIIKRMIYLCRGIKSTRKRMWLVSPPCFHYHIEYPEQALYFLILITFSSLVPIIAPIGLLYFASKWFVSRYFIFFIHRKRIEGMGKLWVDVFGYMCISLAMYQLIMMALFLANGLNLLSFLCALLVFTTILYRIYAKKQFYHRINRVIVLDQEEDSKSRVMEMNGALYKDVYKDPIYDWRNRYICLRTRTIQESFPDLWQCQMFPSGGEFKEEGKEKDAKKERRIEKSLFRRRDQNVVLEMSGLEKLSGSEDESSSSMGLMTAHEENDLTIDENF